MGRMTLRCEFQSTGGTWGELSSILSVQIIFFFIPVPLCFQNPIFHKDVDPTLLAFVFLLDFILTCFVVRVVAEVRSPQVSKLQLGERWRCCSRSSFAPAPSTWDSLFPSTLMASSCKGLWLSALTLIPPPSSCLTLTPVRLDTPRCWHPGTGKHPGSSLAPIRNRGGWIQRSFLAPLVGQPEACSSQPPRDYR